MAESENLSVEHPEVVQRILTLATETRQELGEFMQRGSGQRRTGSVVPGAPVISHEKDWGMVDAATVEAIAKERQRRYPAGKKRKGIRQ
jgi:hypothetical protein